jgi:ABC-type transporter Mla MlaB component
LTGDVASALAGAAAEALVEYERRLDEEFGDATQVLLCQYDQHRFETGTLVEMTEAHQWRCRRRWPRWTRQARSPPRGVHPPETLRLAGELDFENVAGLLDYLDANVHGPLRVDLADIAFADVAGLRALRGGRHQQLTIADASEPVRRLVGLLGWDTDPASWWRRERLAGAHNLFFYGDDGTFVDQVVPFLSEGLADHEAVVIVLDPRKTALVRDSARADRAARRVHRPRHLLHAPRGRARRLRRPGAPVSRGRGAARARVRRAAAVPDGRRTATPGSATRRCCNPAFAHHPVTIVCGLDGREQSDRVVEGSWHTHPTSLDHGWSDNTHFHDPAETCVPSHPSPTTSRASRPSRRTTARAPSVYGCGPR